MRFNLQTADLDARDIYITGNFNGWNPRDYKFILHRADTHNFYIDIDDSLLPEFIEYKFTKGGWENVELTGNAEVSPNRKVHRYHGQAYDTVDSWRLNWGPFKPQYFPVTEIISEQFYIPQLDRYRKVWILLPFDYYSSDKYYPVLYLQDAQNLFNEGSEFGNWEIDKKLALLSEYGRGDLIVVAVEHGSESRINEYIFDNNSVAKNSEGKKYIRFITDTLKPYIDQHFRTKRGREHTGIGGSSLGGLISIYSGFLYPEVHSKLMIFSPSLWIEPNNNFPVFSYSTPYKTKVYLYSGSKEGPGMVKRVRMFEEKMKKWEKQRLFEFKFRTSINPEGTHNEFYWSQEFPKAVEWLFYDNAENPAEVVPTQTPESYES